MKKITILLFLAFVAVCSVKLSAEPVKTSETTFILTEDDPTVDYEVSTVKAWANAQMLAIKANEDIFIVDIISDEVFEGMKFMNAKVVTFTHKNVEVYFYNGRTYAIIHR